MAFLCQSGFIGNTLYYPSPLSVGRRTLYVLVPWLKNCSSSHSLSTYSRDLQQTDGETRAQAAERSNKRNIRSLAWERMDFSSYPTRFSPPIPI